MCSIFNVNPMKIGMAEWMLARQGELIGMMMSMETV